MSDTVALVVHPGTGEALAIRDEPTDRVAKFRDELTRTADACRAAAAFVDRELIDRMDKAGVWTHRVRVSDDLELELKAPSPTAGTTTHDPQTLRRRLERLVADGIIDRGLLEDVCARTVTVSAIGEDGRQLEAWAGERGLHVDVDERVPAAGVQRLERIGHPRVAAAVKAARQVKPNANRRLSVTQKSKARR